VNSTTKITARFRFIFCCVNNRTMAPKYELQTKLKVFWNIRNKALYYDSTPSENNVKALIELANIMEKKFVHRLESGPILTERHRQIIVDIIIDIYKS
jgi:hypothetical protein